MEDIDFLAPWNPTQAAFAAYKKREVELAVKNLSIISGNLRGPTLHSTDTIDQALAIIRGTVQTAHAQASKPISHRRTR